MAADDGTEPPRSSGSMPIPLSNSEGSGRNPELFRLRARWVLPLTGAPIENGAVSVAHGSIARVGAWTERFQEPGPVFDLGEVILMPGLINAHCHLDYTHMGGRIPARRRFTDWIQSIVALKNSWSEEEFAASWVEGARRLLGSGTTTVADVEAVPSLIPDLWAATPLRVISFRELLHLKPHPWASECVDAALQAWSGLPLQRVGLSPHAPYSTSPDLLRHAARAARDRGWRRVTHVAESEEEFDMFQHAAGPMFNWLKSQRDMSDCGRGSPVRALETAGYLGSDLLAIHLNYLAPEDTAILARHGVHAVHCPGSHNFFQHRAFPYEILAGAGVNICLGTDSMASMPREGRATRSLDLFCEMRTMAESHPGLRPGELLRMATVNAARALGREGELGQLVSGAQADMIALPHAGSASSVEEAVLEHVGSVRASMVDGEWALAPE